MFRKKPKSTTAKVVHKKEYIIKSTDNPYLDNIQSMIFMLVLTSTFSGISFVFLLIFSDAMPENLLNIVKVAGGLFSFFSFVMTIQMTRFMQFARSHYKTEINKLIKSLRPSQN